MSGKTVEMFRLIMLPFAGSSKLAEKTLIIGASTTGFNVTSIEPGKVWAVVAVLPFSLPSCTVTSTWFIARVPSVL